MNAYTLKPEERENNGSGEAVQVAEGGAVAVRVDVTEGVLPDCRTGHNNLTGSPAA